MDFSYIAFLFLKFIYIWKGGGRGSGRGRERIPGRLSTVSMELDVGLELTNHEIMTWAEIKSWMLNQLSHPGAPHIWPFLCWGMFTLSQLCWEFLSKWMLYFIKCFLCNYWKDNMVLILYFINVLYHINWFANMESCLQAMNKFYLIVVNDFF